MKNKKKKKTWHPHQQLLLTCYALKHHTEKKIKNKEINDMKQRQQDYEAYKYNVHNHNKEKKVNVFSLD